MGKRNRTLLLIKNVLNFRLPLGLGKTENFILLFFYTPLAPLEEGNMIVVIEKDIASKTSRPDSYRDSQPITYKG